MYLADGNTARNDKKSSNCSRKLFSHLRRGNKMRVMHGVHLPHLKTLIAKTAMSTGVPVLRNECESRIAIETHGSLVSILCRLHITDTSPEQI